jgi:hypothetical protein
MKLVAVSIVKNEADIIEVFVRHTRAWVDLHLVFDHDSTDGTREILAELVKEGWPLLVFTGDSVANLQQQRSNHLARLAFTEHGADWVLPLDADEILVATDRKELERLLTESPLESPVSVLLRNYSPSTEDNLGEKNPVRRICHRNPGPGTTSKIFVPRSLGLRNEIAAGKGNHALYRGDQILKAHPLTGASLAHFALRSPAQQVLRVVTAELQKLSRGRAHEGLDMHYRLGFQLLSEDADLFFSTIVQPAERLHFDPTPYLGGETRYSENVGEFMRGARALLPFLEKLSLSHGQLADGSRMSVDDHPELILPLDFSSICPRLRTEGEAFCGFTPVSGWQPTEGPVPEAFLPRFHWATGPETQLIINVPAATSARMEAQALSYAPNQIATVCLNGVELLKHPFPRINQKEFLIVTLPLQAGDNQLVFRHATWIESIADPRKLALIFLSLRVSP